MERAIEGGMRKHCIKGTGWPKKGELEKNIVKKGPTKF